MVELLGASIETILNAAQTISPRQLSKYNAGKLLATGEVADVFMSLIFGDDSVKSLSMELG